MKLDFKGYADGFVQLVNRNRKTAAVVVAVLLLAEFLSFAADAGLRDAVKEEQAMQEKQLQLSLREAQQERAEVAERQRIQVDARRRGELQSDLLRFSNALGYDMRELNETVSEYGSDNLTNANLARKVEVTERIILSINEYKAHLDGFEQFVQENFAELQRLGILRKDATLEDALRETEATRSFLKRLLISGEEELREFVGSNSFRLNIAGEVLQLAEDSIKNFEETESSNME